MNQKSKHTFMRIYTARYYNKAVASGEYIQVGISQGKARWLKYNLVYADALAPSWDMVKMTDKEAYKKLYFAQLDKLGIENIRLHLHDAVCRHAVQNPALPNPITNDKPVALLCYEDLRKPGIWCHRTMFAEWYEKQTGTKVEELSEEQAEPKKRHPTLFELL